MKLGRHVPKTGTSLKILALIPARSGSKSVVDKNIRPINNKPLLAYSIEHAQASEKISRIILDTDSERYAAIGREYGVEIPYLRPAEYATDSATDIDVFYHSLSFLRQKEGYVPDIVVHLRPTCPVRRVEDINAMIQMLVENPQADSVRSIAPARENPFKMWSMGEDHTLRPISSDIPECYNMPRQKLPQAFYQNACIDVTRGRVILEQHSMTGKEILGYPMPYNFDIDTEDDLKLVADLIETRAGAKTFCVDIDGVLAVTPSDCDYTKCLPNQECIGVINSLHNLGNKIILFTARGSTIGGNWESLTKQQMEAWGCLYDELLFGKPTADFYLDDHALTLSGLRKMAQYL